MGKRSTLSGTKSMEMQSLWQVTITVLSGVTVFVVGQVLQKIYIEPVQELKRTIGQVAASLTSYANTCDPVIDDELKKEAQVNLRRLSGELRDNLETVPNYGMWRWFANLPTRTAVLDASTELIGLSNSVGSGNHDAWGRRLQSISQYLSIDDARSDRPSTLARSHPGGGMRSAG